MARHRPKKFDLSMVIVAMGFIIIAGIWLLMEPGGWPLDWRLTATLVVFGILTGGTQRTD